MVLGEKKKKTEDWVNREGGRYGQNGLYKILKGLTKFFLVRRSSHSWPKKEFIRYNHITFLPYYYPVRTEGIYDFVMLESRSVQLKTM